MEEERRAGMEESENRGHTIDATTVGPRILDVIINKPIDYPHSTIGESTFCNTAAFGPEKRSHDRDRAPSRTTEASHHARGSVEQRTNLLNAAMSEESAVF